MDSLEETRHSWNKKKNDKNNETNKQINKTNNNKFENCSIRKSHEEILPYYSARTAPWRVRNSHWKNMKTQLLYFHCNIFQNFRNVHSERVVYKVDFQHF
jgi:hypothetical protein